MDNVKVDPNLRHWVTKKKHFSIHLCPDTGQHLLMAPAVDYKV